MHPTLLEPEVLGVRFSAASYPVFLVIGGMAGFLIARLRCIEARLNHRGVTPIILLSGLAGLAGAWGTGSLLSRDSSGFVLYGGLISCVLAALLLARGSNLPALRVLDILSPSLLLGVALCRVGCFFAGCCYGVVWGAGCAYPAGSPAHQTHVANGWISPWSDLSLPTVPLPLLESLALLAIFATSSCLWRRSPRPGTATASCGVLYPLWRCPADLLRGDAAITAGSGLTFSQLASLLVLAASLLLLRWRPGAVVVVSKPSLRPALSASLRGAAAMVFAVALLMTASCEYKNGKLGWRELDWDCNNGCDKFWGEGVKGCGKAGKCLSLAPPNLLKPGEEHRVELVLESTLDGKPLARMEATGVLTLVRAGPDGMAARGSIQTLLLDAAGRRWTSTGELDLSIGPGGKARLRTHRVAPEIVALLKALEPPTAGTVRIEADTEPSPEVLEEALALLSMERACVQSTGVLTLDGRRYDFAASGGYEDDHAGGRRCWGNAKVRPPRHESAILLEFEYDTAKRVKADIVVIPEGDLSTGR
jgi:phosphatidylglycerol:prolipoprotein diacylglycerol transferase